MESNDPGHLGGARAKYVWDRDKLSWVESTDEPGTAEPTFDNVVEEGIAPPVQAFDRIEAVEEADELQQRGALSRMVGLVIDMFVILLVQGIAQIVFGSDSVASRFLLPLIGFAYFVGFWTLRGQTPGKMAIGAKIVRLDGSPAGFPRLLARYGVFLFYFYALAKSAEAWSGFPVVLAVIIFSVVALSRSKRGFHDLAGGTMVINSRPQLMEDYEEEVWEAAESESDALLLEED